MGISKEDVIMNKESFRALISLVLFLLCIAITLPFVTGFASFANLKELLHTAPEDTLPEETFPEETPPLPPVTQAPVTTQEASAEAVTTASPESSSAPEVTTEAPRTTEEITTAAPEPLSYETYPFKTVDKTYFADAMFVGDSRMEGLRDGSQGFLDNALFFCGQGWNTKYILSYNDMFKLGQNASTRKSIELGKDTIQNTLKTHSITKIYIMLGINDADPPTVYANTRSNIRKLQEWNPNLKIILLANPLAVKGWKNKWGCCNDVITEMNNRLKSLADWEHVFYIDVNDVVGDGAGNLNPDYKSGDYHVSAKGNSLIAEWLYTKGV